MRSISPHIAWLAAVALGASPARAAGQQPRTAATDHQALVALENEWLTHDDSATLTRILAEDFVHPVASGDFVTKSQHIGWVTMHHPPRSLRHRLGEDLKNRQLEAGIALTVMGMVPSL